MYALFDYVPLNASDSRINTISASTEVTGFPASNLLYIAPTRAWKSSVITASWVKFYYGSAAVTYRHLFINRFNFANFTVDISSDDTEWTTIATITSQVPDEIADENYMHKWIDLEVQSYKYLRISISEQTPLFEASYFKIGNVLVGNAVEIYNPKPGFEVEIIPINSIVQFKSGKFSVKKLGRTKRVFSGEWDKMAMTEDLKIIKTGNPIVIYNDFENNDTTRCYLVQNTKGSKRNYNLAANVNVPFNFEEIV